MMKLRHLTAGAMGLALAIVALAWASASAAKEFDYETFTQQDFDKFFGLIEDGKVSAEKLNAMCDGRPIGFTVAAKDAVYDGKRINFNVSQQLGSIDGRSFRSRYHNASLGEWVESVFKPLCPGLYVVALDVLVSKASQDEANAQIVLRQAGEPRPGRAMTTARIVGGGRRTGHGSVVLALSTGDEVSAMIAASNGNSDVVLEHATLTVAKIAHLGDLISEFDQDAWDSDLKALQ